MLDHLCSGPVIDKIRYREQVGAYVWEIDVFEGENAGLVVAEVELPSPHAKLALPSWAGREVTDDARFFNSNLARHPYSRWAAAGPPHGC
jgi:adenylate cyclase